MHASEKPNCLYFIYNQFDGMVSGSLNPLNPVCIKSRLKRITISSGLWTDVKFHSHLQALIEFAVFYHILGVKFLLNGAESITVFLATLKHDKISRNI